MIVSRRWLEALLGGRALDARDVADRLTAHAAAVDAVVPLHGDLGDIVIARVLEVKQHPNADRLTLCLVDAGGGRTVEVVCGAPNVRAGNSYPYAPVGAVLPGGAKLERKTIRGVASNGMLCSAKELGLGEDHTGILELDTSASPGTRFTDAVPVADHQIVIDVPASRPDLLCHKGVARELGASLGVPVKLPEIPGGQSVSRLAHVYPPNRLTALRGVVDSVEVRLEDPEGAPRYMIAVIRGVRVGSSPAWLADRLAAVGQRSINNVVDATNYILLELNQPLHAFDLAKLRGPAVVVRRARPGEKIVTLDGMARTLTSDMTAICDAERPTIVAGVMGSAESEVGAATTDLVLECAYFQPTRIRRTRRALELSSESSYRFERGIDMLGMPDALRRALELIVAVAGGAVREPPLDLWPEPVQERTIFLRPERVSRLLGVAVERAAIERHLTSVGFFVAPKEARLAVQVPGWRPDVTREVDLIEEVARFKLPEVPFTLPRRDAMFGRLTPAQRLRRLVEDVLVGAGYAEVYTSTFAAKGDLRLPEPLSAEAAALRTDLSTSLLDPARRNADAGVDDVALFEIARVYHDVGADLPEERWHVAGTADGGFAEAKWAVEQIYSGLGVEPTYERTSEPFLHPGKAARTAEGWLGELHPATLDGVWGAFELDLDALTEAAPQVVGFEEVSAYPEVRQDLAFVVDEDVSAADVLAAIREAAGELLRELEVFDEYRGEQIGEGKRSLAFRLAFGSLEGTLTDEDVAPVRASIVDALATRFDAVLRA